VILTEKEAAVKKAPEKAGEAGKKPKKVSKKKLAKERLQSGGAGLA